MWSLSFCPSPFLKRGTTQAGWTCLFFATYRNKINIIQFLLMRGADPDHQDKRGMKAVDLGPDDKRSVFAQFESALEP